MLRIFIDNVLVPLDNHSDISESTFTLSRSDNTTGATSVGFSETMTFYNDTAQYIRNLLIDSPQSRVNVIHIEVKEVSDCCNHLFYKGIIRASEIEWCDIVAGEKVCQSVSCQSIEDTPYTCIQSTLIAHNDFGFQTALHPFVPHCIELRPNFVAILVYLFAVIIYALLLILTPIIFVFSTLISVINGVLSFLGFDEIDFSDEPGTQDLLTVYNQFREQLVDAMIGCGNGQFAPYVRDYLINLCRKCNLQLDSTIFQPPSPYYNTMYYVAAVSKIKKYDNPTEKADRQADYFRDNAPNLVGTEFLNDLILAFNAGWEVRDNKLIFERKDFFFTGNDLPINPVDIIKICFKYKDRPEPQFAILAFQPDGIDTCGNEALRRYYYRLQNYDPTNINPNLAGRRKYPIPFAPSHYRNDGIDTDVISIFNDIPIVGLLFPDNYDNALILPDNLSFVPKLLIHKTESGFDNAVVKFETSPIFSTVFDYNKDFWATPTLPAPFSTSSPHLYYDRFFKIDEPLITGRLGREYEMEVNYDCEFLQEITLNKTLQIDTGGGVMKTGNITNVTISNKSIILRGEI